MYHYPYLHRLHATCGSHVVKETKSKINSNSFFLFCNDIYFFILSLRVTSHYGYDNTHISNVIVVFHMIMLLLSDLYPLQCHPVSVHVFFFCFFSVSVFLFFFVMVTFHILYEFVHTHPRSVIKTFFFSFFVYLAHVPTYTG